MPRCALDRVAEGIRDVLEIRIDQTAALVDMNSLLSSRAGWVINGCYLVTLAAPVASLFSIRLVRRKEYAAHRRLQTILACVGVVAVLALETRIRLAGGSGALLRGSPHAGSEMFRVIAAVHIAVAVCTYAAWVWLLFASRRAFGKTLPGPFSRLHKRVGWGVISGLAFTAGSASVVYYLAFVA